MSYKVFIRVGHWERDYYMFIRQTIGLVLIVECDFIDTKDIQWVDELHEQKDFGKAIAE